MTRDQLLALPPGASVRCGPDPGKPGRPSAPPAPGTMCAQQFLISLRHFLPDLPAWLAALPDPRPRPDACTYSMQEITDLKPNKNNAMALAKAGRLRWKIENEGINTQKNGGYEMEHGYGVTKNAWKNYYLLMQLAQLLNDLCRLGDLSAKLTGDVRSTFTALYGTVRNFAARLTESLRTRIIDPEAGPDPGTIQIRLPDPPMACNLN